MDYDQIITDSIEFARQRGFRDDDKSYHRQPIISLIFNCAWASAFFGKEETEWRELFALDKERVWGNRMFLADNNTMVKVTVPLWVYHQHRLLDAWQHGAVDDIFQSLIERINYAKNEEQLDKQK